MYAVRPQSLLFCKCASCIVQPCIFATISSPPNPMIFHSRRVVHVAVELKPRTRRAHRIACGPHMRVCAFESSCTAQFFAAERITNESPHTHEPQNYTLS